MIHFENFTEEEIWEYLETVEGEMELYLLHVRNIGKVDF